jgi:hypothetical protein
MSAKPFIAHQLTLETRFTGKGAGHFPQSLEICRRDFFSQALRDGQPWVANP